MDYKTNWKNFLEKRSNVYSLIAVLIILIITLSFFSRFVLFIEDRKGFSFNDPFLSLFNAIDLNVFIFLLIYLSIFGGFIYLSRYPAELMKAIGAYIILVWVRTLLMYSLPLDPPQGVINLQDPIVFLLGTGKPITRDLFFSGHTSTLFLIFLSVKNKKLKALFLTATILVGISVILQKSHYPVDVFTAPFIAYAACKIAEKIFPEK